MRTLLRAAGHEAFTPTYTGLGERAHLAHPMVDLETHIRDVLAVIEYEDLADFVLVGHSYGGMVAAGVADRVPDKLRHLVYLDAFVPADGQSLDDLTGAVREGVEGWLLPPSHGTCRGGGTCRRGASARRCGCRVGRRGSRASISIARRRPGRTCFGNSRTGSAGMRAGGLSRWTRVTART
jgi:pimeloyl-ACP methyl ester carboxylesterase